MPVETLSDVEIDRMVDVIAPEWQIRGRTPLELGGHPVYRLGVETHSGGHECYLKATPKGASPSVALEARLLSVIGDHTSIPVPSVYGAVDEHDDLSAPFVLISAMPGESRFRTELASYPEKRLRRLAHASGSHLAELHSVDAVDSYGFLTCDGPTLHGSRPSGDFDSIGVSNPTDSWHDQIRHWSDVAVDALRGTRFADTVPEIEPVIESRIEDLEGPFRPVLARIDQSLDNVVVDDGELAGLLDWEFTIAATPAYDLAHVAFSLEGGPYAYAPRMPDRSRLIRTALLAGYRKRRSEHLINQVRANWPCYELITTLRAMIHLEDWYRGFDLDDEIDAAAASLRTEVSAIL